MKNNFSKYVPLMEQNKKLRGEAFYNENHDAGGRFGSGGSGGGGGSSERATKPPRVSGGGDRQRAVKDANERSGGPPERVGGGFVKHKVSKRMADEIERVQEEVRHRDVMRKQTAVDKKANKEAKKKDQERMRKIRARGGDPTPLV
jgi:hypothetical protein